MFRAIVIAVSVTAGITLGWESGLAIFGVVCFGWGVWAVICACIPVERPQEPPYGPPVRNMTTDTDWNGQDPTRPHSEDDLYPVIELMHPRARKEISNGSSE